MRSMLVIGLGRFGTNLALTLMELGNEVLIVDRNETVVNEIALYVTKAQIGDCMEETALKSLGVENFDVCFVCISEDFQSSLEITSLLKDLGAKLVVAKADRDIHAKFLKKIGADQVIYPERDMAKRTAVRYNAKNVLDYIELTSEYAVYEINLPSAWAGKSLRELAVRSRHNINVIGRKMEEKIIPITDADYRFQPDDELYVVGDRKDIGTLLDSEN